MITEPCCDAMASQLDLECPDHPDRRDCPGAVVVRGPAGDFQMPIRDGSGSFLPARFCPWCGAGLADSGPPSRQHRQWKDDHAVLGRIGAALFPEDLDIAVELPPDLAQAAVDAWDRDEVDEWNVTETERQKLDRRGAAALALIGIAVSERGNRLDDGVVSVELSPWLVGTALDAAEQADLLGSSWPAPDEPPSNEGPHQA